jgi:hypothetical protein
VSNRHPGSAPDLHPALCDRLEADLAAHGRKVILAILLLAACFRLIYFIQISAGPCLYQHRWAETDMNFFDLWSQRIAAGDLLTNQPLHPIHDWHRAIAAEYFRLHPGEEQTLLDRWQGAGARPPAAALLWDRWLGGKTFHQEPIYPYMLALWSRLSGHDLRWVFLWQMLQSLGGILLVYLVARRYFGDLVAVVAAGLVALCAPLLYYDMLLLRESMIGVAGLLLVYLIERALAEPRPRRFLALGIVWGLAALLKSHVLLMLGIFLGVYLWTHRRAPQEAAARAGVLLIGLLVALTPAIARNLAVGVNPLSLSSVGPITYVCASTPDCPADAGFFYSPSKIAPIMAKADGKFLACVLETLKTYGNPLQYGGKLMARFAALWNWFEIPNNSNFYYFRLHAGILRRLPVTFWAISPLALAGLALGARRAGRCWPLYALVVSLLLALVFFGVSSRLRAPLLAPLSIFAAVSLVQAGRWLVARKWTKGVALAAAVVVLGLWTGRSLPAGREMIRPVDYITPYTVFWGGVIDQTMAQGDYAGAAAVLERSLRFEPDSVKRLGPARPARTPSALELAEFYSRVHKIYGQALQGLGRPQEAQVQRERAEELAAAASR